MRTNGFLAGFMCIVLVPQAYSTVALGFKLEISTSHAVVRIGDPVHIAVILTSTNRSKLLLPESVHPDQAELDYRVTLKIQTNGSATGPAKTVTVDRGSSYVGSKVVKSLDKGEKSFQSTDLDRIIGSVGPGTYVIQFSRDTPDHPGVFINSNVISVRVIQ